MANKLYEVLESRILLLDGGFGTMVQQYGFTEEDYRGERFRDWNVLLKGCNDLLAVTRPGAVREIHVKYLQAGADIIETDSFNANAVSLADYGLEAYAYEISRAAAGVARSAADEFTARNCTDEFAALRDFCRACRRDYKIVAARRDMVKLAVEML